MKKSARSAARRDQQGVISPPVIIGGIIALVVIFFIATGSFKFSASVKPNTDKPSGQDQQPSTPVPQSKPKTYENAASGISLEYPASWSLRENPTKDYIVVFSYAKEEGSNNNTEVLGIKVVDTSSKPSVTLQEITDLWENQTKKAEPTLVATDRKNSTVAGADAKDITYTFTDKRGSGKGMVRITLKNKKAYIFQYSIDGKNYDKYLPDIETILSSVKI